VFGFGSSAAGGDSLGLAREETATRGAQFPASDDKRVIADNVFVKTE